MISYAKHKLVLALFLQMSNLDLRKTSELPVACVLQEIQMGRENQFRSETKIIWKIKFSEK